MLRGPTTIFFWPIVALKFVTLNHSCQSIKPFMPVYQSIRCNITHPLDSLDDGLVDTVEPRDPGGLLGVVAVNS